VDLSSVEAEVSGVPQRSSAHAALGSAIREIRHGVGVSQEELAHRSGLHRTYVGGIERGERNPSYTNIVRLSEALSVSPSELLALAERLEGR
jgi:transcriptional regulator with XRE-family HTH domain